MIPNREYYVEDRGVYFAPVLQNSTGRYRAIACVKIKARGIQGIVREFSISPVNGPNGTEEIDPLDRAMARFGWWVPRKHLFPTMAQAEKAAFILNLKKPG